MIKNIILLVIILFTTGFINAQSWKDSLRVGKQYYQEGNYKQAYQSLLKEKPLIIHISAFLLHLDIIISLFPKFINYFNNKNRSKTQQIYLSNPTPELIIILLF